MYFKEFFSGQAHLNLQVKRVLMSLIGVALCGVIVGIFNVISLGGDPFTVFVVGFSNLFHSTYGTLYPFVTGVLLLVVLLVDRHYIHIATLLNLTMIGVIADIVSNLMRTYFAPDFMWQRILWLIGSVLVLCLASSLYYVADLGVSAYDAMALILSKKTPIPFRICRIGTDLLCVLFGFCTGAVIGVGTVITAFFMGPVIHLFNIKLIIPMLYGKGAVTIPEKVKVKK